MRKNTKVVFVFGPGGVGKTTISSAMGLSYAAKGLDVLVVTVDPARRLMDILGIEGGASSSATVNHYYRKETGIEIGGRMDAMMIDSKDAFLNLLRRYLNDEDRVSQITSNRIFRYLSESLIGAHEYLSAERIYDIFLSGEYDIIVVDTAPSKNAFEFIDGAKRMAGFLDKRVIRFFVDIEENDSIGGIFFKKTGDFLYRIMGIIFGPDFIVDMKGFLNSISSMYSDLLKRAYELDALYLSDNVRYLIVGSPQKLSLGELNHLLKGLKIRGIRRVIVIINRAPYFYSRREIVDKINVVMTKCENSDIKTNLGNILRIENQMLASLNEDLNDLEEFTSGERIILPDLYVEVFKLSQLLRLGDMCTGGIRL